VKPGDVVMLNSGGPAMTVLRPYEDGAWLCGWWTDAKTFESESFPEPALMQKLPRVMARLAHDYSTITCAVTGKFIDTSTCDPQAASTVLDSVCPGHEHVVFP